VSEITLLFLFGCLGGKMSLCAVPALITRFVCKLRGGSQPILVEANDGESYVVKVSNNMQGSNLLFNESMGTELYRLAKLPVAPWRQLLMSTTFIEQNPSCQMETTTGPRQPVAGLCFGSLYLARKDRRIYELLPGNYYKRVTNIEDFWLAWLLDVCASHADSRQALFPQGLAERFYAVFIDHGHMFGGPAGDEHPPFGASRYLDPRLYCATTAQLAKRLKTLVVNVDELWLEAQHLPEEWRTPKCLRRLSECLNSLSCSSVVGGVTEALFDLHRSIAQSHGDHGSQERKPPVSLLRSRLKAPGMRGVNVA
jgi:hypothetical protein